MAIDFTRYQPPGIYTEALPGPQLGVQSTVPTAVALFGLSVGYQTYRESLQINPDSTGQTTQIVTITNANGGTFKLGVGGVLTGTIPYNATNAQVQTAINALSTVTTPVVVTGNAGGPYSVVFQGGATTMTYDTTGLTATSGTPSIGIESSTNAVPAINRTLAKQGIDTSSVQVVNPNSGQVYVLGTDYTVTRLSAGADAVAGTADDYYTISRVIDGGHIDPGDVVQLAYNFTDPLYFEVYSLYDYDDVRDRYGEAFDANGNIQSELTLAAYFAFTNGASTVLTCAVQPEDPAHVTMQDYSNALDKFRDEEQIAIIVPCTGSQSIQALVQQHVLAQSNNRYERRAIMGFDGAAAPVLTATRMAAANALSDQRLALISPSQWTYFAPELNKSINVGGQYVAAAVAGKCVSQPVAYPLTRKIILGFQGPAETQREGEKNLESQNGLMVVELTRRNQVQVRHGVSTNPADLLVREWSIIGQQDTMVYRIRDYLNDDGLIGMPIYASTLVQVKASADAALTSLVSDGVIEAYQNLKVRQLGQEPDVIEVRYEWQPAYPLNYIVVRYSVATMTGDVTLTDTGTTTTTTSPNTST
jgi:hypothetical protein